MLDLPPGVRVTEIRRNESFDAWELEIDVVGNNDLADRDGEDVELVYAQDDDGVPMLAGIVTREQGDGPMRIG